MQLRVNVETNEYFEYLHQHFERFWFSFIYHYSLRLLGETTGND